MDCKNCINCSPGISACGKPEKRWAWPWDYKCVLHEEHFPYFAEKCEAFMELTSEMIVKGGD